MPPLSPDPRTTRDHSRRPPLTRIGRMAGLVGLIASVLTASEAAAVPTSGMSRAAANGLTISTTVSDPDDTAGSLDIASVRHRITVRDSGHVHVSYWVTTYAGLDLSRLDARHRNFVLELNRDSQLGAERSVRISYVAGSGLIAEVFSNATRRRISTVAATAIDSKTIRISASRRRLGGRSYFWTSNFHVGGDGTCGWRDGYPITCQDAVPDAGWIRLDYPAWPRGSPTAATQLHVQRGGG